MMSRSNLLSYNLEFGELQQQLFRASIAEGDSGLGVLARTFYFNHRSHSEALMLNLATLS